MDELSLMVLLAWSPSMAFEFRVSVSGLCVMGY